MDDIKQLLSDYGLDCNYEFDCEETRLQMLNVLRNCKNSIKDVKIRNGRLIIEFLEDM